MTPEIYAATADALAWKEKWRKEQVRAIVEACAKLCDDPHEHLASTPWERGYTAAERVCAHRIRSIDPASLGLSAAADQEKAKDE